MAARAVFAIDPPSIVTDALKIDAGATPKANPPAITNLPSGETQLCIPNFVHGTHIMNPVFKRIGSPAQGCWPALALAARTTVLVLQTEALAADLTFTDASRPSPVTLPVL